MPSFFLPVCAVLLAGSALASRVEESIWVIAKEDTEQSLIELHAVPGLGRSALAMYDEHTYGSQEYLYRELVVNNCDNKGDLQIAVYKPGKYGGMDRELKPLYAVEDSTNEGTSPPQDSTNQEIPAPGPITRLLVTTEPTLRQAVLNVFDSNFMNKSEKRKALIEKGKNMAAKVRGLKRPAIQACTEKLGRVGEKIKFYLNDDPAYQNQVRVFYPPAQTMIQYYLQFTMPQPAAIQPNNAQNVVAEQPAVPQGPTIIQ